MGVNFCPDGLEHFFPHPNGQFLVLEGVRTLARVVCALCSSYWPFKKTYGKDTRSTEGGGGSKAILAMPMEKTHFKKGLPEAYLEVVCYFCQAVSKWPTKYGKDKDWDEH